MAKKGKKASVDILGYIGIPVLKTTQELGWTMIIMVNGVKIFALNGPDGNGPGVLFGDDKEGAFRLVGDERDGFLKGRKIKSIGQISKAQMSEMMWYGNGPAVLEFEDGIRIYASRDDEGNGSGQLVVEMTDGKTFFISPQGPKDWSPLS